MQLLSFSFCKYEAHFSNTYEAHFNIVFYNSDYFNQSCLKTLATKVRQTGEINTFSNKSFFVMLIKMKL